MGCLSLSHFLTTRDGIESLTMLFFTLIGGITLYLLPKGVCKFVYRIKSGTDLDKKGDETVLDLPKRSLLFTVPTPSLPD